MSYIGDMSEIRDKGGRRSGIDRRYYSYSSHIPERRKGVERRKQEDRRQQMENIELAQAPQNSERRKVFYN